MCFNLRWCMFQTLHMFRSCRAFLVAHGDLHIVVSQERPDRTRCETERGECMLSIPALHSPHNEAETPVDQSAAGLGKRKAIIL